MVEKLPRVDCQGDTGVVMDKGVVVRDEVSRYYLLFIHVKKIVIFELYYFERESMLCFNES